MSIEIRGFDPRDTDAAQAAAAAGAEVRIAEGADPNQVLSGEIAAATRTAQIVFAALREAGAILPSPVVFEAAVAAVMRQTLGGR